MPHAAIREMTAGAARSPAAWAARLVAIRRLDDPEEVRQRLESARSYAAYHLSYLAPERFGQLSVYEARLDDRWALAVHSRGGLGPASLLLLSKVSQTSTREGFRTLDLLDGSLPTERLRTAPAARPTVNGMTEALLTVRVPFEQQDLVAGREAFACHRTQYTPAEMDRVNAYLAHAWNGTVWLRPWNGTIHDPGLFMSPSS